MPFLARIMQNVNYLGSDVYFVIFFCYLNFFNFCINIFFFKVSQNVCSLQNESKESKGCSYQNIECLALMVNAYAKQILSQST